MRTQAEIVQKKHDKATDVNEKKKLERVVIAILTSMAEIEI